jgi:hypothetical protein
MQSVIYPTAKDYAPYFAKMSTVHLKVWLEVAARQLKTYKGQDQYSVLYGMIAANNELKKR